MPELLLAAQTAVGNSAEFTLQDNRTLPVSLSADGIAGVETITLQFHNGVNWVDFYKDGNTDPERITITNSMLSIWGIGRFRGVKSITAASVPIYLHTPTNP